MCQSRMGEDLLPTGSGRSGHYDGQFDGFCAGSTARKKEVLHMVYSPAPKMQKSHKQKPLTKEKILKHK